MSDTSKKRKMFISRIERFWISRFRFSLILLGMFIGRGAMAQVDWPNLGFAPVLSNGFAGPTSIGHARDGSGRLFIAEQAGRIWIIRNNTNLPTPFLEITNRVLSAGAEQGLLGLAFPPEYATDSHFYVDYTRQPDGAVVVSRFSLTADANVADPNSEEILMVIPKPYNNHNGGQLAFGPDGYLYIGVGDGGSEGDPDHRAQDPGQLLGKLLRIDVESGISPYAVPLDNPFAGNTNYAPEIWALGLRNPWRFSFDRTSGALYIGDVGQGTFEEINFQPAGSAGGQNYGWSIMEGPTNFHVPSGFTNFSALTLPVAVYDHAALPTDFNAAVIGGYVYRGPSSIRMDGIYFFGDFMCGWIWGLKQVQTNGQNATVMAHIASPGFLITTFGEDEQGQLYVADYRGGIYRLYDKRQVETPLFTPTNGIVTSNAVIVGCPTPGAEIHFTTNGVDPTLADPIVASGGTIQISSGATNKARGFRTDLSPSDVASALYSRVYTNRAATPVFSPRPGVIPAYSSVSISTTTTNASIYYTTNNTSPSTNSLLYSGPITLAGPAAVNFQAIAVANEYSNSAVASASYAVQPPPITTNPVFNPPSGPITNGTPVSISCSTTGATLYYALNQNPLTTNSPIYSQPLLLSGPVMVRAMATADRHTASQITIAQYSFMDLENTVVTTFAGMPTAGLTNGFRTLAQFSSPQSLCFDPAGNLYVADWGNNAIRRISPSGQVMTFAGTGVAGFQDGTSTNAQFNGPNGICADPAGNLYVAENACDNWRVRKLDTNGTVTTLYSSTGVCAANRQLEVGPDANLYLGDDAVVRQLMPDGGSAVIGGPGSCTAGWCDGVGIGVDTLTNVYAASQYSIWKMTPGGQPVSYAGSALGYADGPRLQARFLGPMDVAIDSTSNIFVSDRTSIRRIRPDGVVTALAGSSQSGYLNGSGARARFGFALGLCLDGSGNIYVADSANNSIRKISPDSAGIGIADDWQTAFFGRVGIDPNDDPDHDGMSNYAEFWAGTNPLDSNSVLKIENVQVLPGEPIRITWRSVAGKNYSVQCSDDLTNWHALGVMQAESSSTSILDTTFAELSKRFYRVSIAEF